MERDTTEEKVYDMNELKEEVVEVFGEDANEKEVELGMLLVDLLYETRFEKFPVTDITSVKNTTVKGKAELLFAVPEIEEKIIPDSLRAEYPVKFDDETIKKAPWVNMIHAWNKVLNELNTVSAMQKEETPISPIVFASIAHVLYKFTTDADGDPYIRNNEQFLSGGKYAETIKRESGTLGANPSRHVCFEEMKYILGVLREVYVWGE